MFQDYDVIVVGAGHAGCEAAAAAAAHAVLLSLYPTRQANLDAAYVASLASYIVPGILGLLLSLAGLAWTIFLIYTTANDARRQGFHDHYAHSVVIKPATVA